MPDPTKIEGLQQQLHAQVAQANRDAAARLALDEFAPWDDHQRHAYVEVLRRLRDALTRELEQRWALERAPIDATPHELTASEQ